MNLNTRLSSVLYAVYTLEQIQGATRKSISAFVNASMVVVSQALSELEALGIIKKEPLPQPTGGRPTFSYSVSPGVFTSIGLAFTPEKVLGVLVDSDKTILEERTFPLDWPGSTGATASYINGIVAEMVDVLADPPNRLPTVIGFSLPGLVDSPSGTWIRGLQIPGVSRFNFSELGSQEVPIGIEDYTRSLAYYEMILGSARDVSDFSVLNLGLGIGSAVVINRSIYRGLHGLAGEIGHITVDPTGRRCTCGMVGCLETVCSVPALLDSADQLFKAGVMTSMDPETDSSISLLSLEQGVETGDRLATKVVSEALEALTVGIETLTKVLNPERIIMTGPGARLFRRSLEILTSELKLRILPEMETDLTIEIADYAEVQEALGAALVAIDRIWPFGSRNR